MGLNMKNGAVSSMLTIFVVTIALLGSNLNRNWPLTTTQTISTETPIPSPSPGRDKDLLKTFEGLMSSEYQDCILPCWWNLRPGETTIDETVEFLNRTEFDRHWKDSIYSELSLEKYIRAEALPLYFLKDSYFGEFVISFGFDSNDRINSIRVVFNNPGKWLSAEANKISVSEVLSQIPETPEIFIAENPSTFRLSEYHLTLLYRQRGVEVNYSFDLSDDNPKSRITNLNLCLDNERTTSIEMSLLNSTATLKDKQYPENFKTPENATGIGISTEDFVQFFKEHPDECLDVSAFETDQ